MHIQLALLSLAVMINVLGFSLIIPLVPDYVQRGLHLTNPQDPRIGEYSGWLTAVYALMQFVFAPLWGSLSDRIGRKPILIVSLPATSSSTPSSASRSTPWPGSSLSRILTTL